MNTIILVCIVAATLAFIGLAIQAVLTLQQVRHTAKAVEYLALNADSKLTALDPVVEGVRNVSNAVSSGWFKAASAIYGFFAK